jgi:hypothetical protein
MPFNALIFYLRVANMGMDLEPSVFDVFVDFSQYLTSL